MTSTIRFKAKLSDTALTLPKSVCAKLRKGEKIMIEGVIRVFPFRAALLPTEKGSCALKLGKAIMAAADTKAGDTVTVEITRVQDEPETRVPADLKKALKAIPKAEDSWAGITPMARRDWILSICTTLNAVTRKRRIDKACDMLRSGKRRLCCFPGLNWITRDHVKPAETWLPLSKKRS